MVDFLYRKYGPIYKILYPDLVNIIFEYLGEEDVWDEHQDFIDDEMYIPKSQYNRLLSLQV